MYVYRIVGKKYSNDVSGTGAAIFGGRWNKKGTSVMYTGESKEIALLETIVHTPPMLIPELDILTFEIPDDSITEIKIRNLPRNWKDYPAPSILAEIGDDWLRKGQTVTLKVPSCIIHSSHIYILDCRHPDYVKVELIELEDFHFDSRLNS